MALKMRFSLLFLLVASPLMVVSQQVAHLTPEVHPPLTWQKCASGGSCTTVHGSIVLDHNWRWLHTEDQKSCLNSAGNQWDATACPDPVTCAKNCHLDGVNYAEHGISTNGAVLEMKKLDSRIYLMANETSYEVFKLLGQEITFDVDMSKLPCGKNGAIYLVAMEHDGGGHNPNNKAGAKYGTGYCDGQCPKDRFINGAANALTAGPGQHGACCSEFDMWEANSYSTVYTAHPCTVLPYHVCTGDTDCNSICEHDGCGFNSYKTGHHEFYGPGKTVDTNKVMTVVTQFVTSDGTAQGELIDIRRFYVQGGHVIPNSVSSLSNWPGASMTKSFCQSATSFNAHGGLKRMGEGINQGMVLVFSLWGDFNKGMEWLDQKDNGPCPVTPTVTEAQVAIAFSHIRVGPINSTFHA